MAASGVRSGQRESRRQSNVKSETGSTVASWMVWMVWMRGAIIIETADTEFAGFASRGIGIEQVPRYLWKERRKRCIAALHGLRMEDFVVHILQYTYKCVRDERRFLSYHRTTAGACTHFRYSSVRSPLVHLVLLSTGWHLKNWVRLGVVLQSSVPVSLVSLQNDPCGFVRVILDDLIEPSPVP